MRPLELRRSYLQCVGAGDVPAADRMLEVSQQHAGSGWPPHPDALHEPANFRPPADSSTRESTWPIFINVSIGVWIKVRLECCTSTVVRSGRVRCFVSRVRNHQNHCSCLQAFLHSYIHRTSKPFARAAEDCYCDSHSGLATRDSRPATRDPRSTLYGPHSMSLLELFLSFGIPRCSQPRVETPANHALRAVIARKNLCKSTHVLWVCAGVGRLSEASPSDVDRTMSRVW